MDKLMDKSQISRKIFENEVDLQALILTYYDMIRRICQRYTRDENEAEEWAQEFIAVKLFEKDLVGKYQKRSTTSIPFRKYLYRAVANHCISKCRRKTNEKEIFHDPVEIEFAQDAQTTTARQDLEWAMGLLHRAFSKVRAYYVKKGKENYWLIFKESILDKALKPFDPEDERTLFQGVFNAENLLAEQTVNASKNSETDRIREKYLPAAKSNQQIFNIQTTVKRMLITTLEMLFEAEAEAKDDPYEKNRVFQDWMEILQKFDESTFTAMRAALRIGEAARLGNSEQGSVSMELGFCNDLNTAKITPDELAYLLTYRMDMPLTEWMDSKSLVELLPATCPFKMNHPEHAERPLSLGVVLDPTPAESAALDKISSVELLRLVKESSKKLANSKNHAVPPQVFMLFYTLTSLLALTRHHVKLYTISDQELKQNLAWYLKQEWLDDRITRFFKQVLKDPRGI